MKRLPLLLDDQPSLLTRVALWALVPIAFALLLPILLVFVVVLYLCAVFHGVRVFVTVITGKPRTSDFEMQKPHFLEMQGPARAIADESRNPPEANRDAD